MGHAQAAMLAHKIKQVDLRLIASLATAHFYCAKNHLNCLTVIISL